MYCLIGDNGGVEVSIAAADVVQGEERICVQLLGTFGGFQVGMDG